MKITYKDDHGDHCPMCMAELNLRSVHDHIKAWTPETFNTQCANCNHIIKFKVKYVEVELTVTNIPDE